MPSYEDRIPGRVYATQAFEREAGDLGVIPVHQLIVTSRNTREEREALIRYIASEAEEISAGIKLVVPQGSREESDLRRVLRAIGENKPDIFYKLCKYDGENPLFPTVSGPLLWDSIDVALGILPADKLPLAEDSVSQYFTQMLDEELLASGLGQRLEVRLRIEDERLPAFYEYIGTISTGAASTGLYRASPDEFDVQHGITVADVINEKLGRDPDLVPKDDDETVEWLAVQTMLEVAQALKIENPLKEPASLIVMP